MIAMLRRLVAYVLDPTAELREESHAASRRAVSSNERVQECLAKHEAADDPIASFGHHIRGYQQGVVGRQDMKR